MNKENISPQTNVISGDASPEVLYVQGMSNPATIGQYPTTQATVALIISILGMTMCCLLPPVGVMMANQALAVTSQYPGHPDHGMAKAANIVGWIGVGLLIISVLFMIVYFVFIGIIIAAENGA